MTIHQDVRAYHAAQSATDKRICDQLAKVIDQQLRGAEHKIWHRHPVWFLDGNPIVGYHKLKDCVRLLFWSGQSFDEPGLQPDGTFKAAAVRFTSAAQISVEDLRRWLDKAALIQWDYKNIAKRKGRLERLSLGNKLPALAENRSSEPSTDWQDALLDRLRKLIQRADPEVSEEIKWRKPSNGMRGVPVWSHDGILCTGETYKSIVKMTFPNGASLPDPAGLFNSSLEGNTRRAIGFSADAKLNESALQALLRAAVAFNTSKSRPGAPHAKKSKPVPKKSSTA